MNPPKRVLILGAGITGLACARTLSARGVDYRIIEGADQIGGRIKTEVTPEGFRIDLGFQVLLNSYPELPNFVDLKSLKLQEFSSGALIFQNSETHLLANPLVHPSFALQTIFSAKVSFQDKVALVKMIGKSVSIGSEMTSAGLSTAAFLNQIGFSASFIDFFWRPFLRGIFLDADLSLDANYFLFLIRCFGLGKATVPRDGMSELPRQIAEPLDSKKIFLGKSVKSVSNDSVGAAVEFVNGDIWEADVIVQTYPMPSETKWRSVTTYYLTGPKTNSWKKWLVLVSPESGHRVNHLADMSEVSDRYAPPGRCLIAANVLGSHPVMSAQQIISEVETIAQKPLGLELLKVEAVDHALPVVELQEAGTLERCFIKRGPLYFCGDSLSSPSIHFALKSGRAVGEAILEKYF